MGRRVDESNPMVDARLPDGSRVNIIIPPLAIDGATVSIRRFTMKGIGLEQMAERQVMSAAMAEGVPDLHEGASQHPDQRRDGIG